MSEWPLVWLIFATHKRTEVALSTIRSFGKYLKYPNLHFHVADDGSGETDDGTDRWHVGVLQEEFAKFAPDVTWHEMQTPSGQFDFGGNINRGIQLAIESGSDIQMVNVDDMELLRELDIRPHVDVLDYYDSVGFIRLSWLVEGNAGLCVRYDANRLSHCHVWLRLIRNWSVNNPWHTDSYLLSMQPFIAHKRFYAAYGFFPERVNPGITESVATGDYIRHSLSEDGPQILAHIGPCCDHVPYGHMAGRANDYAKV